MLRFDVGGRRGLALALVGTVWCGTARAETRIPPPAGHLRALVAHRVAAAPVIDGALSDPAWSLGATADGFWVSEWQQPPTDQTRVVVLYDDHDALFRDYVPRRPARPHPGGTDHARRRARPRRPHYSRARPVPQPPLALALHRHGARARSPTRWPAAARAGWKGEWQAAAQRTPLGWTAEIAIPLAMLEFDPDTDTFGINFSRYQNRTREWSNGPTSRRSGCRRRPATSPACACRRPTAPRSLALSCSTCRATRGGQPRRDRARTSPAPTCATSGAAA